MRLPFGVGMRMTRITKVVDEWSGLCVWFRDGKYIGHDDQYEIDDEMRNDAIVTVELEKIVLPVKRLDDGWEDHVQELLNTDTLDELKALLAR